MTLGQLDPDDLKELYFKAEIIRDDLMKFVQEHGFTVNDLVTKNMLHAIEQEYGRKILLFNAKGSRKE